MGRGSKRRGGGRRKEGKIWSIMYSTCIRAALHAERVCMKRKLIRSVICRVTTWLTHTEQGNLPLRWKAQTVHDDGQNKDGHTWWARMSVHQRCMVIPCFLLFVALCEGMGTAWQPQVTTWNIYILMDALLDTMPPEAASTPPQHSKQLNESVGRKNGDVGSVYCRFISPSRWNSPFAAIFSVPLSELVSVSVYMHLYISLR